MFTATEALGLVMAVLDGHHDAGDPTDPVGSALGKLMRALPEPVAAQAEAVRRSTAPAADRAAARPDPATTTALVQACSDRRRVRLGYRSEAGSEWVAEVDPWAVVVRHGRWYLLCHAHAADARRAYRIDRVRDVAAARRRPSPSPPTSTRSPSWRTTSPPAGSSTCEVLIDAPLDRVARCVPRTLGRLEALDADRTRLVGSTSNPWWYAEQLAGLPAAFQVVGGPELRHTTRVLGERLLAASEDPVS